MPPYGACDLGSVNLTRFVSRPFASDAEIDFEDLSETVHTAVRFLDNVLDASHYPLEQQAAQAAESRRIGLGVTGLADALIMLGIPYGSVQGRELAGRVLETLRDEAYRASIALAREKGSFPLLQAPDFLARPFIRRLPETLRDGIRTSGIRNSHLLALAPTGSISLLAGNVSTGIEPCFAGSVRRLIRRRSGKSDSVELQDYALRLWQERDDDDPLLPAFVTAMELLPDDHLAMQATAQGFVDNAISKTINVPTGIPFEAFRNVYRKAYELGLKGCTVYRQGSRGADILTAATGAECISGACRTEDVAD